MTRPHASFEVFEEIGRGENTIVYRAYDLHLGREVAIKELQESVAADPRRREQFLRQAKFLAQFDHPAILRVHSIEPERGWIVMDLMKGSLETQISHAALPSETVRSILRQLLPALESLHERGKIHGSIRPSNILIDEDGRVKLSDFEESNYDGELLAPSDTKKYLAPELIRGDFGDIGPATDLYCLAFTALELLAGPSFESKILKSASDIDADVAWLRWHSSADAFPATQRLIKGTPNDLAQTIDKLLHKQVAERCSGASQAETLLNDQEVVPVEVVAAAEVSPDQHLQAMLPTAVREVEPLHKPLVAPVSPVRNVDANSKRHLGSAAIVGNQRVAAEAKVTSKDKLNAALGKPYVLYPLCALMLIGALGVGFALQKKPNPLAVVDSQTPPIEETAKSDGSELAPVEKTTEPRASEASEEPEQAVAEVDEPTIDLDVDPTVEMDDLLAKTTDEPTVELPMEPEVEPEVSQPLKPEPEETLAASEPLVKLESEVVAPEVVETAEPVESFAFPKLEFVSTKINIDELVEEIKGPPELVVDSGGFIEEVTDVAISPDGKLVAAAGGKVVRVWEIATGALLDTLRGDRDRTSYGNCQAVEFSSDGQFLVVGVNDYAVHGSIRVYRVDNLSEIDALLPGHNAPMRKLTFSRDNRWMVSADADGQVALWDWKKREIVKKLSPRNPAEPIFDELQFAGDEPVLAGIDFGGPLLLSVPELNRLSARDPLPSRLHAWIVDVLTHKLNYPFDAQNDPRNFDFKLEHKQWAAAGEGKEAAKNKFWVGVWDARALEETGSANPTTVYSEHKWQVTAIDLACEHQLAASGDKFGEVHVWDSRNGKKLQQFVGKGKPIYEAAFERGSKRIVFGTTPYAPDVWGRNNYGDAEQVIDLEKRAIYELPQSDPGELLQERSSLDGTVIRAARTPNAANMRVEKLVDGRLVSKYDLTTGRNPTVYSILDSMELNVPAPVVLGDNLGLLGIWDSDRDQLKRAFIGHGGLVSAVSRSENGKMILSGSADRTMRIWSLENQKPTGIFDFKFENSAVTTVMPGSSSATAGVQEGDKILAIDGKSITEMYRLMLLGKFDYKPGDSVNVDMQRAGEDYDYQMQLAEGYDFADPILSIYIGEHQEWIIWSPQGYYDASPGAEDLIGWHINRGPDRSAKYFDVQHFREKLYRPDIIDRILGGESVEAAVVAANLAVDEEEVDFRSPSDLARQYPPEIEFSSPARGEAVAAATTPVRARVFSRNGLPIQAVTVLVNGESVEVLEPQDAAAQELLVDLSVELSEGRNEIELVAINSAQSSSAVSTYVAARLPSSEKKVKKHDLNVLAIGISDYATSGAGFEDLPLAASDARLFAETAKQQASGKLYENVHVKVLADGDASRASILDGLQWLVDSTESGDTVAIFVSAHAFVDSTQNFYVGAHDVILDRPRATAISWSELIRTIHEDLPKCRRVVFLDLQPTEQAVAPGMRNPLLDLASPEMATVFFSTNSLQQPKLPSPSGNRGYLTEALLATLANPAADVQPTPPDSLLNAAEFSVAWTDAVRKLSVNRFYPVSFTPDSSRQLNLLQLSN